MIKTALAKQREAGCRVIVVDAITLEDVENIAQACIALNWDVVTVDPVRLLQKWRITEV